MSNAGSSALPYLSQSSFTAGRDAATAARDWRLWILLVVVVSVIYGLLYNGAWLIGGGDDAFYIAVARNLATGQGYTWNGDQVIISPPAWPMLLAGFMRISPTFALIGLLPPTFMASATAIWFWVLRRFASPWRAFGVSLLTALLFQVFRCAMHFYSEAMFCFLLSATVLLCLQINEGRQEIWRIALLLVVCAAMIFERWAGVLVLPMVVFTLVSGDVKQLKSLAVGCVVLAVIFVLSRLYERKWVHRTPGRTVGTAITFISFVVCCITVTWWYIARRLRPTWNRRMIAATLSIVVLSGTFAVTRVVLNRLAHVGGADAAVAQDERRMEKMLGIQGPVSPARRLINAGSWISDFFWPVTEMIKVGKPLVITANVIGWMLFAVMLRYLRHVIRQRQWLWLGMVFYAVVLAFSWGEPVGRYVVPISPLLVLALVQAFLGVSANPAQAAASPEVPTSRGTVLNYATEVRESAPVVAPLAPFARPVLWCVVVAAVLCNLPALAIAVRVVHSNDLAHDYLAGQYEALSGLGNFLQQQNIPDNALCLNYGYGEGRRFWASPFVIRCMHLMVNQNVVVVPQTICNARPNAGLVEWTQQKNNSNVRYYLLKPQTQPGRVWHIRAASLPRMLRKGNSTEDVPFFELYELKNAAFVKVDVPPYDHPIRRVPGM